MDVTGLVFIFLAHYFCGRGIVHLFRPDARPFAIHCLSLITGVAVVSLIPCFLQLAGIAITQTSVYISVTLTTILACVPMMLKWRNFVFKRPVFRLPALYEWPFILVLALLALVSVWRCFYYPPTARDMITGPEIIAEFARREGTMINSVFSIDLQTSNNYFKSPYITGLQLIYKLLVCPFGQLWLSVLFLSFTAWIYDLVRQCIHPFIAGFLMVLFLSQPLLYGYTYVILYDYSNMIFFFCGVYFLSEYLQGGRFNNFLYSAFLLGVATYIRNETLVFVAMVVPLIIYQYYRLKMPAKKTIADIGVFLMIPAFAYFLCLHVFVRYFVPVPFDMQGNINADLSNVSVLFSRLSEITRDYIFSEKSLMVFGYFAAVFLVVLLLDLFWIRKFNKAAMITLYMIVVVYFGLALLGYLLPLFDLGNTTKRGLLKLCPLMLYYLANSGLLQRLSAAISTWEKGKFRSTDQAEGTVA